MLSSQSSLLQKAKEMPLLLRTTLEQDQRGKKTAPPHDNVQGWDGQEEGLAVNIKQEFAIESADKSQPGTASCLSNASAATVFV